MTAAEAKKLLDLATKAGVVNAVTFNYRGNPLVQQARHAIARGDIGTPHFVHGHYLQDWLLKDTDYSWRLEPEKGGASSALGDIGSHWCDLAQHVSGLRITQVLGDITTVIPQRKRPKGSREAFAAAGANERSSSSTSRSRTWRRCWCGSTTAPRARSRSARSAPATRTTSCSRCADRRRRSTGGRSTRTSSGSATATRANEILQKDPSLIDAEVRGYAHLPGGHQEAWADAFCNLMRDIYGFIAAGKKPTEPIRRRSPPSRTATAPTRSSKRSSTARRTAACGRRSCTDAGGRRLTSAETKGRSPSSREMSW